MLIFKEDYLIVVPNYLDTETHSHAMQHIIISEKPIILNADGKAYIHDNIVVVSGNVEHKVEIKTAESLVLLVEPSAALADEIRQRWLSDNKIHTMNRPIRLLLSEKSESQISSAVENVLKDMGLNRSPATIRDNRIIAIIDEIKNCKQPFKTVPEIASSYAISTSRLEHLFKQETGMRLKNYILMMKLKIAYQMVAQGNSITEAAMYAGFSDSAHLAATAKRTTGISISTVFNKNS